MYWACAQVEPRRERLASYTLGLAGYEIYQPLLREQRCSRHGHRKITVTPPLFPGYLFVWVVRGWRDARWSPGVVRLMSLLRPRSERPRSRRAAEQRDELAAFHVGHGSFPADN